MFAHLLELECEHAWAESLALEAEAENMHEEYNAGKAEMSVWLRLYVKRAIPRAYRGRVQYHMANPLTIH